MFEAVVPWAGTFTGVTLGNTGRPPLPWASGDEASRAGLGVREEGELLTLPSTESPEEFYLERGHLVTLGAIDPWNQIPSSAISVSHCAAWKFPSVPALFSWWSLSWHKSPLSMCPNFWFGWESRRGPGLLMAAALTVVALEPGRLCTQWVAAWFPCSASPAFGLAVTAGGAFCVTIQLCMCPRFSVNVKACAFGGENADCHYVCIEASFVLLAVISFSWC